MNSRNFVFGIPIILVISVTGWLTLRSNVSDRNVANFDNADDSHNSKSVPHFSNTGQNGTNRSCNPANLYGHNTGRNKAASSNQAETSGPEDKPPATKGPRVYTEKEIVGLIKDYLDITPPVKDIEKYEKLSKMVLSDENFGDVIVKSFVSSTQNGLVRPRGRPHGFMGLVAVSTETVGWLFDVLLSQESSDKERQNICQVLANINLPTEELTIEFYKGVSRLVQTSHMWGSSTCMARLSTANTFRPDFAENTEEAAASFNLIIGLIETNYQEHAKIYVGAKQHEQETALVSYRQTLKALLGLACASYARIGEEDAGRKIELDNLLNKYLAPPMLLDRWYLHKTSPRKMPMQVILFSATFYRFYPRGTILSGSDDTFSLSVLSACSCQSLSEFLPKYFRKESETREEHAKDISKFGEESGQLPDWLVSRTFSQLKWPRHQPLLISLVNLFDITESASQEKLLAVYTNALDSPDNWLDNKVNEQLATDIFNFASRVRTQGGTTEATTKRNEELVARVK